MLNCQGKLGLRASPRGEQGQEWGRSGRKQQERGEAGIPSCSIPAGTSPAHQHRGKLQSWDWGKGDRTSASLRAGRAGLNNLFSPFSCPRPLKRKRKIILQTWSGAQSPKSSAREPGVGHGVGKDGQSWEPGEGGNKSRAISVPQCPSNCSYPWQTWQKKCGGVVPAFKNHSSTKKYGKTQNNVLDCELNQTCNKPFVVSAFSKNTG